MSIETDMPSDRFDTALEYTLSFSSIGTFWSDYWMKWKHPVVESTYTYIEKGPLGMPVLVGRTVLAGSFNPPNLKDSEE